MRENIGLYRGKRVDNDEWTDGFFYLKAKRAMIRTFVKRKDGFIVFTGSFEVDPETVGEFTGLTDKNGKRIFEGDILERKLLPTKRMVFRFRIAFVPVKATFAAIDIDGSNVTFICDYINSNYETEIIGNIHDNPELLRGE